MKSSELYGIDELFPIVYESKGSYKETLSDNYKTLLQLSKNKLNFYMRMHIIRRRLYIWTRVVSIFLFLVALSFQFFIDNRSDARLLVTFLSSIIGVILFLSDSIFNISKSYIRLFFAGQQIQKIIEDYSNSWIKLTANILNDNSKDEVSFEKFEELIDFLKEWHQKISKIVDSESQEWKTEVLRKPEPVENTSMIPSLKD
jgi:hypothetical protein